MASVKSSSRPGRDTTPDLRTTLEKNSGQIAENFARNGLMGFSGKIGSLEQSRNSDLGGPTLVERMDRSPEPASLLDRSRGAGLALQLGRLRKLVSRVDTDRGARFGGLLFPPKRAPGTSGDKR